MRLGMGHAAVSAIQKHLLDKGLVVLPIGLSWLGVIVSKCLNTFIMQIWIHTFLAQAGIGINPIASPSGVSDSTTGHCAPVYWREIRTKNLFGKKLRFAQKKSM